MNENFKGTQIPEKLLKAMEIAEILNISRAMAYRLMQTGEIPTVQIGTTRRVRPVDLESFIARNMASASN
jgi:excisionase family DNA binding protein